MPTKRYCFKIFFSIFRCWTDNTMADMASHTFHRHMATNHTFIISDNNFLLMFNSSFPLKNCSWQVFHLSTRIASCIFSELKKGKALMLASWWHLTQKGSATGTIGNASSNSSMMWTTCLPTSQPMTESNSSPPLLNMSILVPVAKATMTKLAPSKSQYAPSARPSNWIDT